MTKTFKFLSAALVAVGLASCSSDDVLSGNGLADKFDAEGNAYLKLGINLPSASSYTRGINDKGEDYGEFNDGTKYEYAVENATLVLFAGTEGADEKTFTIASAYTLGSGEWNENGSDQITTDREFVQKINNAGTTGKVLAAYVILNKHEFFEVDDHKLMFNDAKSSADPVDITGMSLKDFMALDIMEAGRRYDANCFLMTNMPYANYPGAGVQPAEGTTVKTLYPINPKAIYASQTAAEVGAYIAEVNVERVLAKVETSWTYPDGKDFFETDDQYKYHAEILGWFIDNTNPTTYVARNYEEPEANPLGYLWYNNPKSNTYRMISNAAVCGTYPNGNAIRTFWAVDPNYNVKATNLINRGGEFVTNTQMKYDENGNNIGGNLRANGTYYYCTENTFDVAHQSEYNTTRVVVAADFGDAFYTIANEPGKKYDKEDIVGYVKARLAERVSFMQWVEDYCNATVDNALDFVQVNLPANPEAGKITITISSTAQGLAAGNIKTGKTLEQAVAAYKKMVETEETGHNDYLKKNYSVEFFKDGVAYYYALIKHFGDYETPWIREEHAGVSNDVNGVYEGLDSNKYLGRYGVVRNNWYKIDIEGIRQIGTSTVPELPGSDEDTPDTPDDQVENYLKVKINITPWVIRKQSVIL